MFLACRRGLPRAEVALHVWWFRSAQEGHSSCERTFQEDSAGCKEGFAIHTGLPSPQDRLRRALPHARKRHKQNPCDADKRTPIDKQRRAPPIPALGVLRPVLPNPSAGQRNGKQLDIDHRQLVLVDPRRLVLWQRRVAAISLHGVAFGQVSQETKRGGSHPQHYEDATNEGKRFSTVHFSTILPGLPRCGVRATRGYLDWWRLCLAVIPGFPA
jgi:hypothetical protein